MHDDPNDTSPSSPDDAPRLIVTPLRSALIAGHDNQLQVLVRLQAPDNAPPGAPARSPLNLALVIDRSGSMAGKPLHEAIACARFVVDRLDARDRVALVSFDHRVQLLAPALAASDRAALHAALDGVFEGGNTNLHGGWREGAGQLAELAGAQSLSRAILLSDGNANAGLTDPGEIASQCEAFAAAGVTTSTYGLGRQFNEELMVAMARAGGGNSYYGDTADDLFEPFDQEFSLLSSLWARAPRLVVQAAPGVQVAMLNGYAGVASEAGAAWRLPDVAYGSEAWALLRLTVSRDALGAADPVPLLSVRAAGSGMDGASIDLGPVALALPALPADAWAAVAEDELVSRRAAELDAAALLRSARNEASHGNWVAVDSLVGDAKARFAGNPWVAEILRSLEALAASQDRETFMKEALYSSARMSARLAQKLELAAMDESDKAAYLRRKKAQGKAEFVRRGPGEDDAPK